MKKPVFKLKVVVEQRVTAAVEAAAGKEGSKGEGLHGLLDAV